MDTGFYHWLVSLSGYGVIALAAVSLVGACWSMWSRRTKVLQHDVARRRASELLHRKIDLEAEQVAVDQELAELWTSLPDSHARWILRSVEEARLVPPRLLELAYRYGFAVPSPELTWQEYGGGTESPREQESPVHTQAAAPAMIAQVNAWGKPKSNGASYS